MVEKLFNTTKKIRFTDEQWATICELFDQLKKADRNGEVDYVLIPNADIVGQNLANPFSVVIVTKKAYPSDELYENVKVPGLIPEWEFHDSMIPEGIVLSSNIVCRQ